MKTGFKLKIIAFAVGVFAIGINLRAEYDPTIGRFLSRDPIEEPGFQVSAEATGSVELLNALVNKEFEPEYTLVKNDPINKWDYLGLAWKVSRQGDTRAKAERDKIKEDTIGILASTVQLNESEALKWLRNEDGSKVSENDLQTKCSFQVPNTVVAYWAGDGGGAGRWWVNWNSNVSKLKDSKYRVIEVKDLSNVQDGDYKLMLDQYAEVAMLQGTYFWGHGNKTGLGSNKYKKWLLTYSSLNLPYSIAFAYIYACESNSGKSAFNAKNWMGFDGTLYPLNPWDPDWNQPSK